jgi:hypothetical protein
MPENILPYLCICLLVAARPQDVSAGGHREYSDHAGAAKLNDATLAAE